MNTRVHPRVKSLVNALVHAPVHARTSSLAWGAKASPAISAIPIPR
jgi:hypothetical protein